LNGAIPFSKRIPKAARGQEEAQHRLSSAVGTAGFLLFDSTLRPTFVNDEAISTLAYPSHQEDIPCLEEFLERMIRSLDLEAQDTVQKYSVKLFMSGRRRYTCRLLPVSPCGRKSQQRMMALLIERDPVTADLLAIASKFNLTRREYEAVRHLALGLTSKEIAARMGISPNTVKAFLRLAMIKTGVTNRSGIIGKFLKSA
jgi:DNA-binding CsgD family transcriptional regulator